MIDFTKQNSANCKYIFIPIMIIILKYWASDNFNFFLHYGNRIPQKDFHENKLNLFVDESFTFCQKGNLLKSLHMVCKNNGTWNVSSVYYVCNLPHEGNGRHISFSGMVFYVKYDMNRYSRLNVFYRPMFVNIISFITMQVLIILKVFK